MGAAPAERHPSRLTHESWKAAALTLPPPLPSQPPAALSTSACARARERTSRLRVTQRQAVAAAAASGPASARGNAEGGAASSAAKCAAQRGRSVVLSTRDALASRGSTHHPRSSSDWRQVSHPRTWQRRRASRPPGDAGPPALRVPYFAPQVLNALRRIRIRSSAGGAEVEWPPSLRPKQRGPL